MAAVEPLPVFPVLLGPTAVGKSAVAHALAKRHGCEILSVDSMKVYRGMDIGTAKPTPQEQLEVRYHLVDILDPSGSYCAADFVRDAHALLQQAAADGRSILIEGGTALYLKALFEGLFDGPEADWNIRETLEADAHRHGVEYLHRELMRVDPQAAVKILPHDLRRITRALEVYRLTGKPISTLQREETRPPADVRFRIVGLQRERAELVGLIEQRVEHMFQRGLVDEVRALLARGPLSREAAQAIGYQEAAAVLNGDLTLAAAVEQTKIRTRQFSRRQMNWFKRFEHVQWIHLSGETPELHYHTIAQALGVAQ